MLRTAPRASFLNTSGVPVAVNPSSVQFGNVVVGKNSSTQLVTITNIGTVDLPITWIDISGSDTKDFAGDFSGCTSNPIPAGVACAVYLAFWPTATGPRAASIDFTTTAGTFSIPVGGTGGTTGDPMLSIAPASLTFASQLVGTTSPAQKVVVSNTGSADLVISSAIITGANADDFASSNESTNALCRVNTPVPPGTSCDFFYAFTPLAAGARTASLDIVSDGGNRSVALGGTGVKPLPVISIPTASLAFGPQDVGTTSATQYVKVNNTGTGPLTISIMSFAGANASDFSLPGISAFVPNNDGGGPCYAGVAIAAGASCIVQIAFTPGAAGVRTATFTVRSDGGTASVALTGTGVLPPADLSVSVGATPSPATAGKPLTYTITVKNAGPGVAQAVKVTDVLPVSTTFASLSVNATEFACVTPGVGGTGTVTCSAVSPLTSGSSRTITLVVKVLSGGRNSISNTVTVSGASPDPDFANNSATVATTVYGRK